MVLRPGPTHERLNEPVEDLSPPPRWCKVPGASWLHPRPRLTHSRPPNHPVVHVSMRWHTVTELSGGTPPAAASNKSSTRKLTPDGKHLCNIWRVPESTLLKMAAGCRRQFPPNPFGLYPSPAMSGSGVPTGSTPPSPPFRNTTGPAPAPRNQSHEGRLFLCHASYCNRYLSRSHLKHSRQCHLNIGFRASRRNLDSSNHYEIIPWGNPPSDEHSGRR